MSIGRILVVCTGNVCRSPFIERALQAGLDASWGPGQMDVRSAGTGALVGQAMEPQAAARLAQYGGTDEGFVARDLTAELVADADLVLTATRRHRGLVASLHPRALRYVFTFREFADLVSGLDVDSAPEATPRERVHDVVQAAAGQRGERPPLSDREADIVDPYRRGPEVFVQMSDEIASAMPAVVAALGCP
jgi:protein-tyrosine phosphatase